MCFRTWPGVSGYLPLLPLLHVPSAKPGALLPLWGHTPRIPARAAETRLPSTFRQLSSKEVCCTSANTTVLPSTTNSSQQLQTSFLRLGIPAPMKAVAWPGLSDGAHPVQVLRGCLTARTGCALAAGAVLSWQPPSPTRSTPLPQELCVYTHTYMDAFVHEAVHAHIHIK